MDQKDASSGPGELEKKSPRPLDLALRIAGRGRREITGLLRTTAEVATDRLRQGLTSLLSDPDAVESMQMALATMASWTIKQGFRADPNAELLFEFVSWLEERHGRARISMILVTSDFLQDSSFLEGLAQLSRLVSPLPLPQQDASWSPEEISRFKDQGGRRLLALLVKLVALEHPEPPPPGPEEAHLRYFQAAPIPERFHRLGPMSQGLHLTPRRPTASRVTRAVTSRLRPDAPGTDLIPYSPPRQDSLLHFLVFSTTFFLQSYLLRSLVEALPSIADELVSSLDDPGEPLDIA